MTSTLRMWEPFTTGSWDANFSTQIWSGSNAVSLSVVNGYGRVNWSSGSQTGIYGVAYLNDDVDTDTETVTLMNSVSGSVAVGHGYRLSAGPNPSGYVIVNDTTTANTFYIMRVDTGITTLLATTTASGITYPFILKTRCVDTGLAMKVWNVNATEPAWDYTQNNCARANDLTYTLAGNTGLIFSNIVSTGQYAEYDRINIREIVLPDAVTAISVK